LILGFAVTTASTAAAEARAGETDRGLNDDAPIDLYGDPLPPGAIARMGTLRDEVGCVTSRIVFSPDGKFLTSTTTCEKNPLRLWDPASGRVIRELKELDRGEGCWPVAFSLDGKLIAAGVSLGTIVIGRTDTGEKIREFTGHDQFLGLVHRIEGMAFSRDAKVLIVHHGESVWFWEIATGARTHAPSLAGYRPSDVVPFRQIVAVRRSGSPASLRFAAPVTQIGRFGQFQFPYLWRPTAISPDGWVAVRQKIWLPHSPFSGRRGVVEIMDCLEEHGERSPDGGLLATADTRESLCLWDVATGRLFRRFHHLEVEWGFAFAPDGKSVVSGGTSFHHWDIARGHEIHRYPRLGEVRAVAFGIDGKSLVAVYRPWPESTARRRLRESAPKRALSFSIAAAPDGTAPASSEEDSTLRLWDVGTGREIRRVAGLHGQVGDDGVALSPDGKIFAMANDDDRGVRLWNVATGREIHPFPRIPNRLINCFSFAPDGKTLVVVDEQGVWFWDFGTGRETKSLRDSSIRTVALAPGGNTLATSDDEGRLWLRELGTHHVRRLGKVPKPDLGLPDIDCLAFTPDGKTLVSGGADKVVTLWDTVTGKNRQRLEGHISTVTAIAITPDGKRMASGSNDGTVIVWDLTIVRRD